MKCYSHVNIYSTLRKVTVPSWKFSFTFFFFGKSCTLKYNHIRSWEGRLSDSAFTKHPMCPAWGGAVNSSRKMKLRQGRYSLVRSWGTSKNTGAYTPVGQSRRGQVLGAFWEGWVISPGSAMWGFRTNRPCGQALLGSSLSLNHSVALGRSVLSFYFPASCEKQGYHVPSGTTL